MEPTQQPDVHQSLPIAVILCGESHINPPCGRLPWWVARSAPLFDTERVTALCQWVIEPDLTVDHRKVCLRPARQRQPCRAARGVLSITEVGPEARPCA